MANKGFKGSCIFKCIHPNVPKTKTAHKPQTQKRA